MKDPLCSDLNSNCCTVQGGAVTVLRKICRLESERNRTVLVHFILEALGFWLVHINSNKVEGSSSTRVGCSTVDDPTWGIPVPS